MLKTCFHLHASVARAAINILRTTLSESFPSVPTPTAKILVPYHKAVKTPGTTTPSFSSPMLRHIQNQPRNAPNEPPVRIPPIKDSTLSSNLGFQARRFHVKPLHLELRSPAHYQRLKNSETSNTLKAFKWCGKGSNNSNTHRSSYRTTTLVLPVFSRLIEAAEHQKSQMNYRHDPCNVTRSVARSDLLQRSDSREK